MFMRKWGFLLIVVLAVSVGLFGRGGEARAAGTSGDMRYQVFLPLVTQNRPAPVAQYTLNGVVFSDANGNGVFDMGEAGVQGVPVELTGTPLNAGPNPISASLTILTNAQGQFSFTVYADTAYTVQTRYNASRYAPTTATRLDFQAPPVPAPVSVGLQAR